MIKRINKTNNRGQTALIMIVLCAAALIFFAITLNWGHIAQTKSLLTVAADQGAALLSSDAASYGEMWKQNDLNNTNQISSLNGIIMAVIAVVVAIICLIITITTAGAGSGVWVTMAIVLAAASVVMAIVNLALQICVVQPGITSMWNALQKQQTIQQQFIEGGISTALQGSVTDQVNITDYFDWNTNGVFGMAPPQYIFPADSIGRFASFYTDRLRMLNQKVNPEEQFFYQQLGEFTNGETCAQNENDALNYPGISVNSYCLSLGDTACSSPGSPPTQTCLQTYCVSIDPNDPTCQMPIPNGFQLNDSCTDSDPTNVTTYNPYCDPCCQPLVVINNPGSASPVYKSVRPTSCYPYSTGTPPGTYPAGCFAKPSSTTLGCNLTSICGNNPNDPSCLPVTPGECTTNNPYPVINGMSTTYPYPFIYDASFQEYENGLSFLDQYGRDQQLMPLSGTVPPTVLTAQGNPNTGVFFPNGVFPYFWEMKDFSPQVDNLVNSPLLASQVHWCVPHTPTNGVAPPPNSYTPPPSSTLAALPDLTQLTDLSTGASLYQLPYTCQGQDCCVNYLADNLGVNAALGTSNQVSITSTNPTITVTITSPGSETVTAGTAIAVSVTATESPGGPITGVTLQYSLTGTGPWTTWYTWTTGPSPYTESQTANTPNTYYIEATASDASGNTGTSSPITVTVTPAGSSTGS